MNVATERESDSSQRAGRSGAVRFVLAIGIVSLFADMTHEGARSLIGPFLAVLGASATVVGVVSGLGELLGYAMRFYSGRVTDKTGQYWPLAVAGYCVNLMAVPLLALAGRWEYAAALVFVERAGRALRQPPRDVMLSFAGKRMGIGWAFALHEAMDQTGATLGPLLMAAVMCWRNDYPLSFGLLLIPGILSLTALMFARRAFPNPRDLEATTPQLDTTGLPRTFWLFLAATGCVAAGFADYPLIAFHFQKTASVQGERIPILYSMAMLIHALGAVLCGWLYNRFGMRSITATALVAIPMAPLVFLGDLTGVILGMAAWGLGMGAQESLLKAAVASMAPLRKRGTAFGVYNMSFGVSWFVGSALMGVLYDTSIAWLVTLSIVLQTAAALLLGRVAIIDAATGSGAAARP